MEPTFRIADDADIDVLVESVRQLHALDQYPFEAQIARTALVNLVHDPSLGRVWLISDRDEAIGYIALTFGYSLEFHGRDAFIDEFFIKASHRNRGVGTKAMQFVEAACHDLGIHALHLEVERGNTPAQALYRKVGFEDHDRYLMTKWISK